MVLVAGTGHCQRDNSEMGRTTGAEIASVAMTSRSRMDKVEDRVEDGHRTAMQKSTVCPTRTDVQCGRFASTSQTKRSALIM